MKELVTFVKHTAAVLSVRPAMSLSAFSLAIIALIIFRADKALEAGVEVFSMYVLFTAVVTLADCAVLLLAIRLLKGERVFGNPNEDQPTGKDTASSLVS